MSSLSKVIQNTAALWTGDYEEEVLLAFKDTRTGIMKRNRNFYHIHDFQLEEMFGVKKLYEKAKVE